MGYHYIEMGGREFGGLGRALVALGIVLLFLGLALMGKLPFFGRLPGDIRIERPGFVLYFPLTSMLILSAVISLVLTLLRK